MKPDPPAVPKVLTVGYLGVVTFSMLGALASRVFHVEADAVGKVASLFVLLLGAANIAWLAGTPARVVAVLLFSGLVEAVGVSTGVPFGSYTYTNAWWPTIHLPGGHLFPAAVPLAWLLVVGGLWLVLGKVVQGWRRVLSVGLSAALVDAVLEDLMTHGFQYWAWRDAGPVFGVPLSNSLGWFLTASAVAGILGPVVKTQAREPAAVVLAAYCALMGEMAALANLPSWPIWLAFVAVFAWLAYGRGAEQAP